MMKLIHVYCHYNLAEKVIGSTNTGEPLPKYQATISRSVYSKAFSILKNGLWRGWILHPLLQYFSSIGMKEGL